MSDLRRSSKYRRMPPPRIFLILALVGTYPINYFEASSLRDFIPPSLPPRSTASAVQDTL